MSDNQIHLVLRGLSLLSSEGVEWAHSSDVANILSEKGASEIHWRRVQSVLDGNRDLVVRRKRNHRWQYKLLDAGRRVLDGDDSNVVLIEPNKALQSTITFHNLLGQLQGQVCVCDPYIESASIDHLDALSPHANVRYLTHNIKNEGSLRRVVAAFSSGGRHLEIRKTPKADIHDRYIIDKSSMVILGTSLNGFGKKQSFIIKAGQDMRKVMLQHFKDSWDLATVWN